MAEHRTTEERRAYAVARSIEQTRRELAPLRCEIADRLDEIGWRRARAAVQRALGRPVQRRGLWLLGKRDTRRVLEALRSTPRQPSLFTRDEKEVAP